MKRLLIRLALTATAVFPLAACKNGGQTDLPSPTAAAPATASLESVGGGFAALFRTDANTEPRDATDGDIVAISFTTEPSEI